MNIKDIVSNGKKVNFLRYQNSELWYVTECGFEFPVPLSDTGNAAFQSTDKAMFFMRWINQHIKDINQAKAESLVN